MNKLLIFPVILVVLIGLSFNAIISPNLSRSFHHTLTKSIDLNSETVEGLKLYNNINSDSIVSTYGKQTQQSRDVIGYNYHELRKGIEVAVDSKGDISRFIVTDEQLVTAKGIKLGDSDTNIKNAYGNNHYYRREQGADILGYIDKARNVSIEFWMHDNKIVLICLDDTSMK